MKLIKRIRRIVYLLRHPETCVPDLSKPISPTDPIWDEDGSYSVVWGFGWRELFRQLK